MASSIDAMVLAELRAAADASETASVVIFSVPAAPTTNSKVGPPKRLLSLNFVWTEMSLISAVSAVISLLMAALSSVFRVPLENCTLSSRTRLSIECTSVRAPSAVWTSEMPSCALRWAC
jgi:hypothetical protein